MMRSPGALFASLALLATFAPPAHAIGYDVGVIQTGACPGFAAPLRIFIDNEDHHPASSVSGWTGSITTDGNRNTSFYFCRVDGHLFRHVPGSPYLVLSLGSYCPWDSLTVQRHFDAENPHTGNPPTSSTNIDWSAEGLPEIIGNNSLPDWYRKDVTMTFCLFDGTGYPTGPMPALGIDYGVFAPSGGAFAIASGLVYTDDSDGTPSLDSWKHDISGFRTSWSSSSGYRSYGSGALEGQVDTWLRTAKVRGTVCSDGICSGSENCGTCPQDCGACAYCGDGWCQQGEYCPQDCGFCGDAICNGNETCSSCCGDCGPCAETPWGCAQSIVATPRGRKP